MNNARKRSEGAAEKLGGKIKGGIGRLVGNERMAAVGEDREARGRAKEESAKAAERRKGKVEEVTGVVKNRVGAALDKPQMQAEGKVRELKGQARQRVNRP
jgi:uncharacterized protein YjbJ (UPF0337 family)